MQERIGNGIDYQETLPLEPAVELGNVAARRPDPVDYSRMISIITAWKDILNARLLALMALAGAMVMFGFCMYDPSSLRLTGVSLYSIGVLWPVIALFLRKG